MQVNTCPQTQADFALEYVRLGYKVFPLHSIVDGHCTCRDSDCRSPGKHPRTPRGAHDASTDAAIVGQWWHQWPDANIGMTLEGLAVIDVDPRNGGDATLEDIETRHGRLPDTALALTGGGGRHFVYRAPAGIRLPAKLGPGVDFKHGAGAYIVVAPSLHASGNCYAWEASSDLLEGFPVAPMPAWIGQPAPQQPGTSSGATGFIPPQQAIELRSAMAFLPADDRPTWLMVGMALHSTGAPNAFGLWTEWSQLSDKYRAEDQRRVWASFKPDGSVHVEAIFAAAARAGWVNPASAPVQAYSDAVQAAIAAANARTTVELVEPETPDAPVGALPVAVLEEAAQWMDRRYALTHPAASRQAVLALAALGSSRVYVGDGGTPAQLCLGIIADSAILTTYARDAIARVLNAAGLRRMMRGTRANSAANVYGTLFRSPAAIHVIQDFGHLAQFAKRQPSGVLDQAFGVMADAYSSSALYLDSAAEAGLRPSATDDQMVVHAPALTTLLLSTHEQMGALLQRNELTRGLMAYQLPVIVDTAGAVEHEAANDPVPEALRDALRAVRRLRGTPGGRFPFAALWHEPMARMLWKFLLPSIPFDAIRYRMLREMNVQPHGLQRCDAATMTALIGAGLLEGRL